MSLSAVLRFLDTPLSLGFSDSLAIFSILYVSTFPFVRVCVRVVFLALVAFLVALLEALVVATVCDSLAASASRLLRGFLVVVVGRRAGSLIRTAVSGLNGLL